MAGKIKRETKAGDVLEKESQKKLWFVGNWQKVSKEAETNTLVQSIYGEIGTDLEPIARESILTVSTTEYFPY